MITWDDVRNVEADLREQAALDPGRAQRSTSLETEAQAFDRMTPQEKAEDIAYQKARRNAELAEIADIERRAPVPAARLARQIAEAKRKAAALEAALHEFREHLDRLMPIAEGLDWQYEHLLRETSTVSRQRRCRVSRPLRRICRS